MEKFFIPDKNGIRLSLRVIPSASVNKIEGIRNGALLVKVTVAPEKGKANKEVVKMLAKELGVARSSLNVIAGEKAKDKIILLSDPSQILLAKLEEWSVNLTKNLPRT